MPRFILTQRRRKTVYTTVTLEIEAESLGEVVYKWGDSTPGSNNENGFKLVSELPEAVDDEDEDIDDELLSVLDEAGVEHDHIACFQAEYEWQDTRRAA